MSTGILKFFKPLEKPLATSDESTNRVLLDPKGPLTKVLSSSTIKMVNDEVTKVYEKWVLQQLNRSQYLILTPAQRFKLATEPLSTVLPLDLDILTRNIQAASKHMLRLLKLGAAIYSNCFNMRLI